MALHLTPMEHDENPPATWQVIKITDRLWHLLSKDGKKGDNPIDSFKTKHEAEQARTTGRLVELYRKEGDWFAGLPVPGWNAYKGATQ